MVARRINFYLRYWYLARAEEPAHQLFLSFGRNLIVSCKTRLIAETRRSLKIARAITAIMFAVIMLCYPMIWHDAGYRSFPKLEKLKRVETSQVGNVSKETFSLHIYIVLLFGSSYLFTLKTDCATPKIYNIL